MDGEILGNWEMVFTKMGLGYLDNWTYIGFGQMGWAQEDRKIKIKINPNT